MRIRDEFTNTVYSSLFLSRSLFLFLSHPFEEPPPRGSESYARQTFDPLAYPERNCNRMMELRQFKRSYLHVQPLLS